MRSGPGEVPMASIHRRHRLSEERTSDNGGQRRLVRVRSDATARLHNALGHPGWVSVPALNSTRYAEVFNETKSMGSLDSAVRTADQTSYALFRNASYFWDSLAVSSGKQRHQTWLQNARILGLLNIAMAEAGHRLLGSQVLLRILATRNRHSIGRLGWKCGDHARGQLGTSVCHAGPPRVSLGPLDRQFGSDPGTRSLLRESNFVRSDLGRHVWE